ncbi:hypothetical protein ACFL9T_22925 [Thermodesulfobacteriota bacterium]
MPDHKRSRGTAHAILSTLRQSAWPLFLTGVLYRVIAFTILTPLVSGLAGLFLSGSGRIVVADEEIAAFFLEPLGFVALIVMAAVSLTLFALEQACLMTLVFESNRGGFSMVAGAFRYAWGRILAILRLAG